MECKGGSRTNANTKPIGIDLTRMECKDANTTKNILQNVV